MAGTAIGGLSVNNPLTKTVTGTPGSFVNNSFVKGVVGGVLNALPGYSTLGANISNPNVNYLGVPNPGSGSTGQVAALPTGDNTAPTDNTSGNQIYASSQPSASSSFLSALPSAISSILGGADTTIANNKLSFQQSARDSFNSLNNTQGDINTARANNELNRLNAIHDITTFVRNGLHAGGTALSGRNATSSSGAEALARAFAMQGSDKAQSVNNQAAIQGHTIDASQAKLNTQRDQAIQDFASTRDQYVNAIGSQAQRDLADLEAQGAAAGITGQVDINGQKQAIIDKAMAALSEVDNWFKGQVATLHQATPEETAAAAYNLSNLGVASNNPFSIKSNQATVPTQLQGPAIDQLPIYTSASIKKQQ